MTKIIVFVAALMIAGCATQPARVICKNRGGIRPNTWTPYFFECQDGSLWRDDGKGGFILDTGYEGYFHP